jgi:hypothetical protein
MNIFNNITTYIRKLDEQERLKYIGMVLGFLILSVGIFLYRFSSVTSTLQKRLLHINKQRIDAGPILLRYAQVIQQKQHVDTLLQADPNFRIIEFITTTCQELGLTSHLVKKPEPAVQTALDGYIEEKSTCQLHDITMQQIVNLLDKIEQNERIYTKEIHISRSTTSSSLLDLNVDIATFEAKEA